MAETTNKTAAATAVGVAAASAAANIAPATTFSTSGAPAQLVPDVDPNHPAVDNDPRAGTTVGQNAIDFNDPTKPGYQAVAERFGMKVEVDPEPVKGADETAPAVPAADKPKA